MIDTSRSLRVVGSRLLNRDGPAKLITVDGADIIVRMNDGFVGTFYKDGKPHIRGATPLRLENEPVRTTTRYYARRSASRPNEIKLQTVRPQLSIGEIEIDVENNRIVGARVVS